MTPEEFILQRKYLKNVSPRTLAWDGNSFKAFQGAIGSKAIGGKPPSQAIGAPRLGPPQPRKSHLHAACQPRAKLLQTRHI